MWEHYKKTFLGIQAVIWIVTISVYLFFGRDWQLAAGFFLVMQFGAVSGSLWAVRLRSIVQRRSTGLLRVR